MKSALKSMNKKILIGVVAPLLIIVSVNLGIYTGIIIERKKDGFRNYSYSFNQVVTYLKGTKIEDKDLDESYENGYIIANLKGTSRTTFLVVGFTIFSYKDIRKDIEHIGTTQFRMKVDNWASRFSLQEFQGGIEEVGNIERVRDSLQSYLHETYPDLEYTYIRMDRLLLQ